MRWMHRLAPLALVFWLACSMYQDVEAENGWRGVKLGTRIDDHPSFELWRDEGPGHRSYVDPAEKLTWGKARLTRVEYHFYDDVLFKVIVGAGSSKKLLPEITADFGTPSFETPWEWHGETVEMKFKGSESDSSVFVTIWNKAMEAKRLEEHPARLGAAREAFGKKMDAKKARVEAAEAAEKAKELTGQD